MTVLGNRATSVERSGLGFGLFVAVGLAALAVGLVVGLGLREIVASSTATPQTSERGAAVTANLAGLWESGMAQQQAMTDHALIRGRVEAGVAQSAAIERASELSARTAAGLAQAAVMKEQALLQARIEAGIAQSNAFASRQGILQSRIESGLAQHVAMTGTSTFGEAWAMRGEAAPDHVDALTVSGLVQGASFSNR